MCNGGSHIGHFLQMRDLFYVAACGFFSPRFYGNLQFLVESFFWGGEKQLGKRERKGRAARWTSQCFDSLPTAR